MGECEGLFETRLRRLEAARAGGDGEEFERIYDALLRHPPAAPAEALCLAEAHLLAGAQRACLTALRPLTVGNADPAIAGRAAVLRAAALREIGSDGFPDAARAAVAVAPASPEGLGLLARHLLVEEDFPAALRLYRRIATLDPGHYEALVSAAASAFGARLDADAEALARRAVAVDAARPEAYGVLAALHRRQGAPLAALHDYVNATGRARGRRVVPVPPCTTISEGNRGLCDTILALTRGGANVEGFLAVQREGRGDPKSTPFTHGNLRDLSSVPADGRFHPLDAHGSVHSRRLGPPEVERLRLPANYRPTLHRDLLLGSSLLNWYRDCYKRYAWNAGAPFPEHYGSDGCFITRVDGACSIEDFVFSRTGEFIPESTLLDELVLAAGMSRLETTEATVSLSLKKVPANLHVGMPCVLLSGYHLNTRLTHYGSWLFDVAPKLGLFQALEETRDLPIVLPERAWRVPYVRETLEALGIPESRLIRFNTGAITFERLYLAQSATRLHTPSYFDWLRESLFKSFGVTPDPRPRRRYYLSRGDTNCRRIINEAAMMRRLEALGFERLESTPLSMAERVRRFAEAECVIGVSGAGMGNVLFCPPTAKVIEIYPATFIEPLYWIAANHLGLEYYAHIEERVINPEDDFLVSLERLDELLEQAGIR